MAGRAATAAVVTPTSGVRQVASDYLELTKPKVQSLLIFTTVTTMYVAGNPSIELVLLTCLGGYLSAGGAGAVNHWYDRDIDAGMSRTANRPVPSGRVSPAAALTFGLALAALAILVLARSASIRWPRRSPFRASSATCSSTPCGSSAPRRRTS